MAKKTESGSPFREETPGSSQQSVKFDSNITMPQSNKPSGMNDFSQRLSKPNIDDIPVISGRSSVTLVVDSDEIRERPQNGRALPRFSDEVDAARTDILLIACSFVSGVLDSAAFNAWGSFASMQTGNVVFLALGASGQPLTPSYRWAKSLIAISSFMLGTIFFSRLSRLLQPLRRSTLVASFTLQTAAILTSSILVHTGIVDSASDAATDDINWMQVIPLSLLAFQAAGQIVTSRLLGLDEIPTVVLTTVICDLLLDRRLFSWSEGWKTNPGRTRRLGTFLALFIGAMVSGALSKATGLSSSLWLATGVKVVITLCWVFWGVQKEVDVELGISRAWR